MTQSNIQEMTLSLTPKQASDESFILKTLQKKLSPKGIKVKTFTIIRKSIDARKTPVKINLSVRINDEGRESEFLSKRIYNKLPETAPQIVIIGAGPAGLFAALKAIELGLKPIVVERGKDVDSRRIDIANISREGKIDPDSNYCFGEGGAGAFSDGKLYTRSKKRGNVREVLEILHQFGASEDVLILSHPHIGSDKLPGIIKNIREKIKECGGDVKFGCKATEILIENKKVSGIRTSDGNIIEGAVFLATGHSSRDTIEMLKEKGIRMESKGIAVGVRLEHPQHLIDKMQYHNSEGRGKYLPAAEYSFVNQIDGRGVYSFCMCPGGVIVPAMSAPGEMVVNGMSASARSGKWANSGYVVEIHPEDLEESDPNDPLLMLKFQKDLEKHFMQAGEGDLKAPAQKITDFIQKRVSKDLPSTSYAPGIYSAPLHKLFPQIIGERLKGGLEAIGSKCKEFIGTEGVMIGLESRTSSPVRIPRNNENYCHVEIEDLYPVGEGAGYAGGIVSSAIDGMNCVEAYSKKIKCNA